MKYAHRDLYLNYTIFNEFIWIYLNIFPLLFTNIRLFFKHELLKLEENSKW